jgi:hypothetical protein
LVLADDGRHYALKWAQNAQHRRVLVNEAIAAELLKRLRIASPRWAIVKVSRAFIAANPDARIAFKNGYRPVEAGLHFGSQYPGDPEKVAVYDWLPPGLLKRLKNARDFMRILVWDIWVDNKDGRQAVFFRAGGKFAAEMIDNGMAFGFDGAAWTMRDQPFGKAYPPLAGEYLSPGADAEFALATANILAIPLAKALDEILHVIPEDWVGGDRHALTLLFGQMGRRAPRLPDLLLEAKELLRGGQRRWA